MAITRLNSALVATGLAVASIAALGPAPAHAAAHDSQGPTVLLVQQQSLSSGEKMPIRNVLCPPHAPYLANLSLTPTVPGTPKGMRIDGSSAMSLTQLPGLYTDAQRRVIGWDSSGVVRNDDDAKEGRTIRIEAWCTGNIEEGYTL